MTKRTGLTCRAVLFPFLVIGILMLIGINSAFASDSGTWGKLKWTLNDSGTLTISGSGKMNDLSDPYQRDAVSDDEADESGTECDAWQIYWDEIKKVVIKSGVTSIGDNAFIDCSELTSVTIPNSVVSIGKHSFESCYELTSITLPNSITRIGNGAFSDCSSLTSITLPSGVTYIGDGTFSSCYCLTSITLPSGITSIGDYAFSCCYKLASVTIPNGVTSIGGHAFYKCGSLTSIVIPGSVTSIGDCAFESCQKLENINVDADNPSFSSSDGVLYDKKKTVLITCPCTKTSVTIPNSVTRIGNYAFSDCDGLTSITIPNSVASIGDYAFYFCKSLANVDIPSGAKKIGGYAFCNCDGLLAVRIPESVISIGSEVFYNDEEISIYCYDNSTARQYANDNGILSYLLDTPISNADFKLPAGLKTIESQTFARMKAKRVRINENTTTIGSKAFYNCPDLVQVYIPANCNNIASDAFANVTGLTIFGEPGSYAETYAKSKGIVFAGSESISVRIRQYILDNALGYDGILDLNKDGSITTSDYILARKLGI